MKFSFVILHYITIEDTIECTESILNNIMTHNAEIIIVDNGSPNKSGDKLKSKYHFIKNVHVITLEQNIGFAKGNNIGYMYAKNSLSSDFIVMLNNDTIIEQHSFIENIEKLYEEKKFHVLGPDIISTKDLLHQNPQKLTHPNIKEVKKMISHYRIHLLLDKLRLENLLMRLLKGEKNKSNKIIQKSFSMDNWKFRQENVQLHGSCLIFSPLYINKYNGLYSNTFMYMEEDILSYIAKKESLLTMYSPEITILHKEDSSTDALFQVDRHKRKFKYTNVINSAKEFLLIIENNELYKKDMIHGEDKDEKE